MAKTTATERIMMTKRVVSPRLGFLRNNHIMAGAAMKKCMSQVKYHDWNIHWNQSVKKGADGRALRLTIWSLLM